MTRRDLEHLELVRRMSGRLELWAMSRIDEVSRRGIGDWDADDYRAARRRLEHAARTVTGTPTVAPLLLDSERGILEGGAMFYCARLFGIRYLPVIQMDRLTDSERDAFRRVNELLGDELELELDDELLDLGVLPPLEDPGQG